MNSEKGETFATLSVNNIQIHSKYNPKKEAAKFLKIKCSNLSCSPSAIIILGAGLGYLVEAVKKAFTGIKIITIYYSYTIFKKAHLHGTESWHEKLNISLSHFLKNNIGELDIEGLSVIEWTPSAHAFPSISEYINRVVHQTISELTGSLRTTISIGKRWIKNSLFNFLYIIPDFKINFSSLHSPILITASGPSLYMAADLIKKYRNKYILLALPSSLLFLASINVEPDLTIVTDPGFYSFYHFENYLNSHIKIAMPLSAPSNMHSLNFHSAYFSQPYFFEQEITKHANLDLKTIASGGTVAATALEFALKLTDREIIFAGLDFCYTDIKSHAEPNSFDFFNYLNSTRTKPLYTETFSSALKNAPKRIQNNGEQYRLSEAFSTYAGYFNSLPSITRKNIYRIFSSPVELSNIKHLTVQDFKTLTENYKNEAHSALFMDLKNYPSFKLRKNILLNLLQEWLTIVQTAQLKVNSSGELYPFKNNSKFINLSYYIVPQLLIELKRSARLKGKSKALKTALLLFKEEKLFLAGLKKIIEEAKA